MANEKCEGVENRTLELKTLGYIIQISKTDSL